MFQAKKQDERSAQEQEDTIEQQWLDVERQEAEREAEKDRRARQKDGEEQERLQQLIQQEQWQQHQEDLLAAWKAQRGGGTGWEGIDDGQVEDRPTVSQHVRAGNPEEQGDFPSLRKVATATGKKGGGKKAKKEKQAEVRQKGWKARQAESKLKASSSSSSKSASANKQPSTPVREWHASEEGEAEAEPDHVGCGGGPPIQFGSGAGSPEQQRYLAESVAQLKRQHQAQQAAQAEQQAASFSEQQAALEEAQRNLMARERELEVLRHHQAQAAAQQQAQAAAQQQAQASVQQRHAQAQGRVAHLCAAAFPDARQHSRLAVANAPAAPTYQTAEVVMDANPGYPELVSEASVVMAQPVMSPMSSAPPVIVPPTAPAPPAAAAPRTTMLTLQSLEADDDYRVLLAFLTAQGMTKHKDLLIQNEVSFDTMLMFEECDYKELGIAKGPRVKMLRTCKTWHAEQLQKLHNLA